MQTDIQKDCKHWDPYYENYKEKGDWEKYFGEILVYQEPAY
jgi:hypothetical protein